MASPYAYSLLSPSVPYAYDCPSYTYDQSQNSALHESAMEPTISLKFLICNHYIHPTITDLHSNSFTTDISYNFITIYTYIYQQLSSMEEFNFLTVSSYHTNINPLISSQFLRVAILFTDNKTTNPLPWIEGSSMIFFFFLLPLPLPSAS